MFWKKKSYWKILHQNWKTSCNRYNYLLKLYYADNGYFTGQTVSEKFYCTKFQEEEKNREIINKCIEKLIVRGPREISERPITENQRKVHIYHSYK